MCMRSTSRSDTSPVSQTLALRGLTARTDSATATARCDLTHPFLGRHPDSFLARSAFPDAAWLSSRELPLPPKQVAHLSGLSALFRAAAHGAPGSDPAQGLRWMRMTRPRRGKGRPPQARDKHHEIHALARTVRCLQRVGRGSIQAYLEDFRDDVGGARCIRVRLPRSRAYAKPTRVLLRVAPRAVHDDRRGRCEEALEGEEGCSERCDLDAPLSGGLGHRLRERADLGEARDLFTGLARDEVQQKELFRGLHHRALSVPRSAASRSRCGSLRRGRVPGKVSLC
jgi:hypothetical protein